jgi:uncharacterized protein (TIGR03790 family)
MACPRDRLILVLTCVALLTPVTSAVAQSGQNVLLVVNEASPLSAQIADHYAVVRAVPQVNVVRVKVAVTDEIARADFERLVEAPLAQWLTRTASQDRILFIVLTKGVPLRVAGTSGRDGNAASVDSELALLYRKMAGLQIPAAGHVPNPYFLGNAPVGTARPFTHEAQDIYLVTRLDGFTLDDVLQEIDRGAAPSREGKFVLDSSAAADSLGNQWLRTTADWLNAGGFKDRVIFDATARVITNVTGVLGYYSWGSNDPAIRVRTFGFTYAPGALAAMFVSSDGRTFDEPPATWQVGTWSDRRTFFANSPQSLTGDLLREGATGAAGHVSEPYLDATIRPNVLFPAYVSGFNLAESFYLAMPYVSWQTVVVGDPLCSPFPRKPLSLSEIEKGTDPVTEWPVLFSARRLRVLAAANPGVKPEVLKLMLRAEAREAKQDRAGARQALEQATALDNRLNAAHFMLASIYEQNAEYDKAIDRYRRILAANPSDAVALNNLAYSLAARMNQPAAALPFAQKAFALANGAPAAGDTLGWVQHLLGNDHEAAGLIAAAARALPGNGEIRFHLAAVLAVTDSVDAARRELDEALRLDPGLDRREDVKALRAKLKG